MLFEGQLDEGVLAVLIGTRLLGGRGWVKVDNYLCTTKNYNNESMMKKRIYFCTFKCLLLQTVHILCSHFVVQVL